MKCREIKNRFIDYLDDNLDINVREEFEIHIKNCEQCAKELSQFRILYDKLGSAKRVKTPEALHEEFILSMEKEQRKIDNRTVLNEQLKIALKIAACIILFITGAVFGVFISNSRVVNARITRMEGEISRLKESFTIAVFNEHTVSQKIKAVHHLDEENRISPALMEALANALNNDDNINVRLAAAKSLFRYDDLSPEVRELLIKSLVNQNEPMVQILIIDYLVNKKDKRAIDSLRYLVNRKETNSIVKQYAIRGMETLL